MICKGKKEKRICVRGRAEEMVVVGNQEKIFKREVVLPSNARARQNYRQTSRMPNEF